MKEMKQLSFTSLQRNIKEKPEFEYSKTKKGFQREVVKSILGRVA